MPKISLAMAVLLTGLFLPAFSPALFQNFYEEPFLVLLSPRTTTIFPLQINVQHHFDEKRIASMTLRLGYAVRDDLNVYLASLYHNIEISGNQAGIKESALDYFKEYEALALYSPLRQEKNHVADLGMAVGLSKYWSRYKFLNVRIESDRIHYLIQLLAARSLADTIFITLAPTAIIMDNDAKTAAAVMTGIKIHWHQIVAVFAEYPLLLDNPLQWQQPWSVGLQFSLGPGILSVFATNLYGYTLSNWLRGRDRTYYGFRISF